jgi:hypothetical protein
MQGYEYRVSLRIRHPSIDPAELTTQLGLAPLHSWRAGDERPAQAAEPAAGSYRETYWLANLPRVVSDLIPELPLEGALMFALAMIQRSAPFWDEMLANGGTARFIVEVYGGEDFTLDLSRTTLAKMSRLGVAISVDIHAELMAAA